MNDPKFWLVPLIVVLVAGALFAGYMVLYRRQLNAALNSSNAKVSRLKTFSPILLLIALVFLSFTIIFTYCLLSSVVNPDSKVTITGENGQSHGFDSSAGGIIDIGEFKFRNYTPESVTETLIGDYAPGDDIKGYSKYEYTDGDIRFVYYADSTDCGIMPALLIYAEYTGAEKCTLSEGSLHVDTTNWDGKTSDSEGWITESGAVWYSVENFWTTGQMTLTHTSDTDSGKKTGTLTIDVEKAFNIGTSAESKAE